MIAIFFSAAFLVAVADPIRDSVNPSKVSVNCTQSVNLLPCNILHNTIDRDGLFSLRKETLETDCPKLLDSFRCLKDHWAVCNPFSVDNLVAYMSGVKTIFEELCDPSTKLRIEYVKHSPCLALSSQALYNCIYVAENKAKSQWRKSTQPYLLSANIYRCLAHVELGSCVWNVASNKCGSDAGEMLGRLVERSVRPYRHLNCYLNEHLTQPSRKEEYERLLF